MSFLASEDAILDAARQATGLDDFGDGPWRDHFRALLRAYDEESKLTEAGTAFIIEPQIRFQGQPGEQATFFIRDPSGNALEFKAFDDESRIFAK